jgi:AraC-like DNA-binding protein
METDGPRYREYPVTGTLAPYVKCIWSLESDRAIYDAPRERILPDGCVELVIHFRDPFRSHFANGVTDLQPRSFVAGQMRNFLEIAPAGRVGLIAVRFHARGAYLFFPTSLRAVTAAVVELEEVWGKRAREWTERVALARGMATRVPLVEEWLWAALRQKDRYDRAVDRCLNLIDAAAGQIRVAQLASEIGLCRRQLNRRFENAVGVSPKQFARVSRFLNGVRSLRRSAHPTLTDTALECGYFDQAHFNHDFRKFAGMTPSEFLTSPNVVF